MKSRSLPIALLGALAFGQSQRPIQLVDILAWKHIQAPAVSNDGQWFAYRLAPAEGDAEAIVRNLRSGKEQRFPIGDPNATAPPPTAVPARPPAAEAAAGSSSPAFSGDSRWVAFAVYPSEREAKRLKKDRKPIQTKAVLVELASGQKTEFEKVRRFAFSGEKSSAIALQRYGPEPAPTPGGASPSAASGAAPGASGGPSGATPPERPSGSDLLLYDLATGAEINFGNVSEFAFDKPGDWLAWLVDAQDKAGNGVELRNMASGAVESLDHAQAVYKGLTWTEKGTGLAVLRGDDDKAFEDKLYTLVAFKDFAANGPATRTVFDPKQDHGFPAGMTISANRNPSWNDDLSAVTFGIHELKAKKGKDAAAAAEGDAKDGAPAGGGAGTGARGDGGTGARGDTGTGGRGGAAAIEEDKPDLVIWHWKDPRLQSMQQVQETADRNFSYLCSWRPAEKKFVRLADETVKQVTLAPGQKLAMGMDVREYELESNLDGRRYQDVYWVDPATGERHLALRKNRYAMGASPDGSQILHYDDGVFFAYDTATGKSTDLTGKIHTTFWNEENDVNVVKPPEQPIGWAKDSSAVLLSDGWDIWRVPVHGGAAVNLTVNGRKDKIRYRRRFRLDPEERGIDLAAPIYIGAYGEWTKKGGIGAIEPGQPGVRMLQWGDAAYTQLIKAKKADVYLYTRENTQESPDYYVAGPRLDNGQRVTEANAQQKDFLWPAGVKLVDYTSTRGDKLQAALYLPANYQAGKRYPTIVYIYEKLSQNANNYPQPGYNGFSISAYTSNGYAVLTPDIVYKVNDPGGSAVACVVPAVKAAIASGVVDAARVAIHGHSWGGYQTAFLVTQTDIFRAAIAGAPLTDMVSMYSLIYWNTGGTNQAIFESSQGRFTGGYWEVQDAYIRNSPVYFAKNVKTPLIILSNDKDGAVDHTQAIEYYNTLRRMGKPVIMLEYKGENHGLRKPENMKDYTVRMREFFDHYLMDKPAPQWMEEGIPSLKMKDHLEERTKEITKAPAAGTVAGSGGQ
jgi:dipeptidyl aminopeptidase/acylaminoacyl peptidase